jgi:hypothetical protein
MLRTLSDPGSDFATNDLQAVVLLTAFVIVANSSVLSSTEPAPALSIDCLGSRAPQRTWEQPGWANVHAMVSWVSER